MVRPVQGDNTSDDVALCCAAAVLAFCRMLTSAEREQCAYFTRMEEEHRGCNFKWRDVLVSASGRASAELQGAATMLDRVDLSAATATLRVNEVDDGAAGEADAGGDRLPATEEDQPSTLVDACRVVLGMSTEDLLGKGPPMLEAQLPRANYSVAKLEARTTYPVQYDGREFQVWLPLVLFSSLQRVL